MTLSCLDAGEEYLARGWNVVPLCPPSHSGVPAAHRARCKKPGKAPLYAWKHLHDEMQTPRRLRWEFTQHPNCNLGVVLGSVSNLVGIDCDDELSYAAVEALFGGDIPSGVLSFRTGRGVRLLFSCDEGVPPSGVLPGGAELLSKGRQTVMPPSVHQTERSYTWLKYRRGKLTPFPTSLGNAIRTEEKFPYTEAGQPIRDGRKRRLFHLACSLRRYGGTPGEIRRCLSVFNERCEPPLPEGLLDELTSSACRYRPAY